MWNSLKKDWLLILPILFIFMLLSLSIYYGVFKDDKIEQVSIINEENKVIIPPFNPSIQFPLGTDQDGYDLLDKIIVGAKWSIGAAIVISLLRTFLGGLLGALIAFFFKRGYRKIEAFFASFSIIPLTMISYFILESVLRIINGTYSPPLYQRISFEIIILVALVAPSIAFYIASEIRLILKKEFIESSQLLGGSRWHIFKKHVLVHIYTIVPLIIIQQFIQVLILLIHLGVLGLFFGGTIVFYDNEIKSVSHEWSGLIGIYYQNIVSHPMIPLIPIIFFFLVIIAAQLIERRLTLFFKQTIK